MELIFEIVRPIGNAIAKNIFANKVIEENSILSDAAGLFTVLALIVLVLWLFMNVFG
jgi:flagellar biogenesis protein FliO